MCSWSRVRPLTVDAARDDDADLLALETDRDKKRKEIAKDMSDLAPMGTGSVYISTHKSKSVD
jgi:hypothetical protein